MACQTPLLLPETLAKEMTLFELDESLSLLMESATEAAADNSGEIPDELRQALLDYCEAFGAKVDNIANYIKSQEFEARNAKSEIDRLQSRQAAAENKVERLKGLLRFFMETRGLRNMKGRLNTIWLRKNSQDSLVVDGIDRIPSEYWRVSISLPHPDLEELMRHLPEGHALRARLAPEGYDGSVRREPDTTKLRTALASGMPVQGAELRRGQHVRLT
jgi:Siphovirus Gp157